MNVKIIVLALLAVACGCARPSPSSRLEEPTAKVEQKTSDGCGVVPTQDAGQYVQFHINVNVAPQYQPTFSTRSYFVRLPPNYDPNRRYPLVIEGHGCGGNGSTVTPVYQASDPNAIIVGLSAVNTCYVGTYADAGGDQSPELAFFDAVLPWTQTNYCVDSSRIFMAGFSSGSMLTNLVGCARAGIVRAQGNASGLWPINPPTCSNPGPIAAMMGHDRADPSLPISGSVTARDRILAANGCSFDAGVVDDPGHTAPYDGGPWPCVTYPSCPAAYPVVWCATSSCGHCNYSSGGGCTSGCNGIGLSVPGWWNFWTGLPAVDGGSGGDADAEAGDDGAMEAEAEAGDDAGDVSSQDQDAEAAAASIQINCGGPAVAPYLSDRDSTGGYAVNHPDTVDTSGVSNPAPMVVYQTSTQSTTSFTYMIPGFVAGSSHLVRLHFAETYYTASGKRTFNVSLNGTQVLSAFDIFMTAGGKDKAIVEEFMTGARSTGDYLLQFSSVVANPMVSGIEIY